jgi:hypothetical protein
VLLRVWSEAKPIAPGAKATGRQALENIVPTEPPQKSMTLFLKVTQIADISAFSTKLEGAGSTICNRTKEHRRMRRQDSAISQS